MRRARVLTGLLAATLAVGLIVAGSALAGGTFTFTEKRSTPYNSVDRKAKKVTCPELSERVGGGASVDGARRAVRLETSRPIPDGWRAVAVETKPRFHKDWSLTVRAVCLGREVAG